MRTTIRIDEALYRSAKAVAAKTGRTVSQVIEDAVRDALRPSRRTERAPASLPTYGAGGLQRGVDIRNSTRLRDVLDDNEASFDALR